VRKYSYARTLHGGCFVCHGDAAKWFGPNAQGVAARHHDATGHQTWVDVCMMIRYGLSGNQQSQQKESK
jgi:cytochrome c551/c552